jgi:ligand-binding SRPBCC domain-containing protein
MQVQYTQIEISRNGASMKIYQFKSSIWLPQPRHEVFSFFSNAMNLEELTPPWLEFHVVTPMPIRMREGTTIDYRLKVRGFTLGWQTRIAVWDPPRSFIDEQIRGPYRTWIHEHKFTEEAGGSLCEDVVNYAPIGGAIINKLFVERDVRVIFSYRAARLQERFGSAVTESKSR